MHAAIDHQLQAKQRDAFVAFYLKQLIPNHPKFIHYRNRINTANDLYEFLLIDNQVSWQIKSSPIAEAISSLQLYINRVMLNLENGIHADKEETENWQTINRHYALWAANQRLAFYPENFINPLLRQHKTPLFKALENSLSQGRINEASVQHAILNYLNEFETISDLTLVNAYQDGSNVESNCFYFVARTRTQPFTYYWRKLDMKQHHPTTQVLYPSAWSSWQEIKLGLAQAVNQMMNFVFFNNRPHIIWLEQEQEQKAESASTNKSNSRWLLKLAFKKFDDTWSSPQSYPLSLAWQPSLTELSSYATVDQRHLAAPKILICLFNRNDAEAQQQWTIDELLTLAPLSKANRFKVKLGTTENISIFKPFQSQSENFLKAHITSNQNAQFLGFYKETFTLDGQQPNCFYLKLCITNVKRGFANALTHRFFMDIDNIELPFEEKNLFLTIISQKKFSIKSFTSAYQYSDIEVDRMNFAKEKARNFDRDRKDLKDIAANHFEFDLKIDRSYLRDNFFAVLWHNNVRAGQGNTPLAYMEFLAGQEKPSSKKLITHKMPLGYKLTCEPFFVNQLKLTFTIQAFNYPFRKENFFFALLKKHRIKVDFYTLKELESISLPLGQKNFLSNSPYKVPENFVINCKPADLSEYVLAVVYDSNKNSNQANKVLYLSSTHTFSKSITSSKSLIRLNTLFAKELVRRANRNLAAIFHPDTQILKEPAPQAGSPSVAMDFEGANGLYFWELFFHVPFLISYRLNQEQRYPEAMRWLNYLFNPQDPQQPWQVRPLIQKAVPAHAYMAPTDPDALAASEPVRYQKAVFLQFIEVLQNYGDSYYRRLTRDDLATAKLFYVLALKLLGSRPDIPRSITQKKVYELANLVANAAKSPAVYASEQPAAIKEQATPSTFDLATEQKPAINIDAKTSNYEAANRDHTATKSPTDNLSAQPSTVEEQTTTDQKLSSDIATEIAADEAATLENTAAQFPTNNFKDQPSVINQQATTSAVDSEQSSEDTVDTIDTETTNALTEPPFTEQTTTLGAIDTAEIELETAEALSENQANIFPENLADTAELFFDLPVRANPLLASAVQQQPFSRPYNQALLDRWDQLEQRLKYLRHGLTLEGKTLVLPLFATPLDPSQLQTQLVNQASAQDGQSLSSLMATIPPYRFNTMLHKAYLAVDHLIQLGHQLLASLERKDNLGFEERQYQQQAELLAFTNEMQQLSIQLAENNEKALRASYKTAQARQRHYQALYDENISDAEQQAIDLRITSSVLYAGTSALRMGGAIANLAPNTFGMAVGGSRWGAPLEAAAWAAQAAAETTAQTGYIIETKEQYRRRRQDWQLQHRQAGFEMEQIQIQLRSEQLQLQIAKKQQQQTQKQQQHLAEFSEFLQSRFTKKQLYQWMIQQLNRLYRQAYDQVVSLCLSTQAAWQYEIGDYVTRFMPEHAWEDNYQGLFAGEYLKLSLQRMDQRYLLSRERELELVKVISLKQQAGLAWEKLFKQLQETGVYSFVLTQKDFDQDYPGHYLRRIKTMSLSFPALLGPYQQVRAILTQTSNTLVYKPSMPAVNYLHTLRGNISSDIKMNLRAQQQIALSSGMDDSGLFSLNFDDERYLPFEGTGAISNWELKFPNAKHPQQQQLLKSLSDIIVHVRYTAKDGGLDFSQQVEKLIQQNT